MFLFSVLKIQNIGEITNFFRLSYPELAYFMRESVSLFSSES